MEWQPRCPWSVLIRQSFSLHPISRAVKCLSSLPVHSPHLTRYIHNCQMIAVTQSSLSDVLCIIQTAGKPRKRWPVSTLFWYYREQITDIENYECDKTKLQKKKCNLIHSVQRYLIQTKIYWLVNYRVIKIYFTQCLIYMLLLLLLLLLLYSVNVLHRNGSSNLWYT